MRSLHDQMKEMGEKITYHFGEDNLSFEKVKGMLLNDADRMSDTKKAEDAFSAQRGFNRKGKRWPRHDNSRKGDGKTGKSFSGLCHYC